jgi:hypothetical protein
MVKLQFKIFWVVTPCNVAVGYQCFGGPCCLHLHLSSNDTVLSLHTLHPKHGFFHVVQPSEVKLVCCFLVIHNFSFCNFRQYRHVLVSSLSMCCV